MTQPDFLSDLEDRGLVHQTTAPELRDHLAKGPITGYAGFDPTAASLHVGSLLPLMGLMRLQRAGHRPIAIAGGGTGLIGDPSGKATERAMLTKEKLAENLAGIRRQVEKHLDFSGSRGALLLDNADWLCRISLIDFLRDVGKHFSVNQMVVRDSVRLRLESREQGMSFTEFTYGLLQAYDFLHLYDAYGCTLQFGGSDQWGNILDGADLVRRLRGGAVFGLTMPLVVKADGKKFGKSEQGNVWLDPALTRPFAFHQFWLNADDADVVRHLRYFTFLPRAEIDALAEQVATAPEKRAAQRKLADEVTAMVHGPDAVARAHRAAAVLFEGGPLASLSAEDLADAFAGAPRSSFPRAALGTPEASLPAVLAATQLAPSKGQARQAIESGSAAINQQVCRDPARVLTAADLLPGGFIVLRRGKKTYHVLETA
ncbi:MAG TPA: tyrosine--tRNA ligase [Planctomycetota bacterium]|nr:tyrosine--tRNA ligase [Planctomycetota bacterium]